MAAGIEVHVVIARQTRPAGTLYAHRRRGTETATFLYDEDYLADPEAYALDPALPLASGQHQTPAGRKLFGAFTDSVPDRWGRRLIQQAERRRAREAGTAPQSLGEVDYLLGVRDDLRQGALRYRTDGPFLAEEDVGAPALAQLPELLDLAARAERDTANLDELRRLVRVGSSLGGAWPKAHVRRPDGTVAIAKFPSADRDTWNVMAWEKVALDLAQEADIKIPRSELLWIGDRAVLVVDRFDRDDRIRVGYVSAMTMLEASDGDQGSYLDIAGVIEEHSPAATADLHELWRRMTFTVLISNVDDHLRNHGFLHVARDQWTLSPAFDLNPDPTPGPKHLSTAFGDADTEATVENVLAVAEYFRLGDGEAAKVLHDVAKAVGHWADVARHHGLGDGDIDAMAPAFEQLEASVASG